MQIKNPKSIIVMALILIAMSANACVSTGPSNEELQALQAQVDALATQNALLIDRLESAPESTPFPSEVDAPPPPAQHQETETLIAEPTPETLPTTPVPAGTPIIYGGWSMTVSPELRLNQYKNWWGLDIYVRNLGESRRIFRFMNAAITALDNLGNEYEINLECPYMGCNSCIEHYYEIKNLNIDGGRSKVISSGTNGNGCFHTDGIQLFKGPIPLNASRLFIRFGDFGPFNGVEVVIDL